LPSGVLFRAPWVDISKEHPFLTVKENCMKKNLLALAVAGAFAAPAAAMAQSFVQIYGTINSDLQDAKADNGAPLPTGLVGPQGQPAVGPATGPTSFAGQYGITGGSGAAGVNGGIIRPIGVNSQAAALTRAGAFNEISNQPGLSSNSSNLGFRGSEDLGFAGMKAIFQIESSINLDSGAGNLGGRNSNVGLAGPFGTVFYGLWDTPYKFTTLKADPFFATSAASFNSLYGSPGFNVLSTSFGSATLAGATLTTLAADAAFDRRQANSVQYWTPNFAGFSARFMYSPGETKQTYALDSTAAVPRFASLNPWMWGAQVQYDNGPIFAALAYEQHKNYFGTRVFTGSAAVGTSSDDWGGKAVIGAQNLWGFSLYGFFERLSYKTDGLVTQGLVQDWKRNAYGAFGTYGFGNTTIRLGWAQASDGSCSSVVTLGLATNQICNADGTGTNQYSLGASYNFSKRTLVYGYYTLQDNNQIGRYRLGTNTGPVQSNVPVGGEAQAFGLGIRHTF
jgi:predicted porin